MRRFILDTPARRSTNTIGISRMRNPRFQHLKRHLDLERVAVGLHPVEPDRLERPAPEALEAAGRVVHRQPGDDARVEVRRVRQDEPVERPVHHRDAVEVARAEHHVGVLGGLEEARRSPSGSCEKSASISKMYSAPVLERVAEAVAVGRAEPHLARALRAGGRAARASCHSRTRSRGAVRRAVVHDQHVEPVRQREQPLEQRRRCSRARCRSG